MSHNQEAHMDPPKEEVDEKLRHEKIDCGSTCKRVQEENQRLGHHDCGPTAQGQRLEDPQYGATRSTNENASPPNLPVEDNRKMGEQTQHQTCAQPESKEYEYMDPPKEEGNEKLRREKTDCRSTCKGVQEEKQRLGHHDCGPSAQGQRLEDPQYGATRTTNENASPPDLPVEDNGKMREHTQHQTCDQPESKEYEPGLREQTQHQTCALPESKEYEPGLREQTQHQTCAQPESKEYEPGLPTIDEAEDKEVKEGLPTKQKLNDNAGVNEPKPQYYSPGPSLGTETSSTENYVPLELVLQNTDERAGSTIIEKQVVAETAEKPNLMLLILPIFPGTPRNIKKEDSDQVQNGDTEDKSYTASMSNGSKRSSLKDESTQTFETLRRKSFEPDDSMAGGCPRQQDLHRRSESHSGRSSGSIRFIKDPRTPSNIALMKGIDFTSASHDDDLREGNPKLTMQRERSTYDFGKILGADNKWAKAMDAFQKSLIENEKEQESISMASSRRESYRQNDDYVPRIRSREFESLLSGRGSFVQDTYTSLHLHSGASSPRHSNSSHRDARLSGSRERRSSFGIVSGRTMDPRPPVPSAQSEICSSGTLCHAKAMQFRECMIQSQRKIPFCKEVDAPRCRDVPDIKDLDDFPLSTEKTVPCPLQVREGKEPNTLRSRTSKRKPPIPTIMEHTDVEPTPPPKKSVPLKKQASKPRPRQAKGQPPPKKDSPPAYVFLFGREYKLVDQQPQTSSNVTPNSAPNTSQSIQVSSQFNIPECCIQRRNSKSPTPDEEGYSTGNDWSDPPNMRYRNPYPRIDPYGDPGVSYGRSYERYGHQPYGYEPRRRTSYDSFRDSYYRKY